ncbi:trypsin, alkaline C-like [Bicyclus anynana]|uniref:Trypsin, alkaline C-like n=1 Tax=Bicyclus anynana TaxID=110368 RepID=A0ABM3LYS2_BICAN|nr:trypsin, alkaline C-like [Bicyclus anynana]
MRNLNLLFNIFTNHNNNNNKPVLERGGVRLYWDRSIITDRTILANKPDIVVLDRAQSRVFLVDITIPYDENLVRAETEKKRKYLDLALEVTAMWHVESTEIIPIVISANGSEICWAKQRIVGDSVTSIDQFPTLVQVDEKNIWTELWSQNCAGNILTADKILSAAHCFYGYNFDPKLRRVRAGATFRNYGGVVAYVQKAYNHHTFGLNGYDGDISVVKLKDRLVYSPAIQRTAIPPQGTVIPDHLPVVQAGWGATSQGGPSSDVLLYVNVFTINNALCAERYATLPNRPAVTPNMICAGVKDIGGKDSCQGDSGGPMMYDRITVGIISWGEGCANKTFPGVSTSVSPYTDWIVGI